MIGRLLHVLCAETFLSQPVSPLSGYTQPSYFQLMSGKYIYENVFRAYGIIFHSMNSINTKYVVLQKCRSWIMLFGGQNRRRVV